MTQTRSRLEEVVKQSPRKWVYLFSEGNARMRDLLGGKGAGVAEMTNAGLPVPPGFTITTEACNAYYDAGKRFPEGMWEQAQAALKIVEEQAGKRFGQKDNPLLVSVRSGAKFSMPGMMDTVLNLGINDETVQGLVTLTGDERFAYDAYRRFFQMFSKIRPESRAMLRSLPPVSNSWLSNSSRLPSASRESHFLPMFTSSCTRLSRRSSHHGTINAPSTTATSTRFPTI